MTINGIFSRKVTNVLLAASILAAAGFLSRLLGFFRNALLAYFYGAGDVLDAYFLAFRLPDFFFNLLLFGAFSAGFVPVFIKLKASSETEAWRFTNDILNLTLIIFAVFGVLFFAAAPWVLKLIAPGFAGEKMVLAIRLSRIMFLQPVFLGVSVIFSGVLQASHRFVSYALAPIFYNLGIIFGILVLSRYFGPTGLAWGVVVGAFFHMLAQYPAAKASGFVYRPVFSFDGAVLKRIFKIIGPRSASLILNQFSLVIMAGVASFLGSGRVAVFNFANDLNGLILGVVAVPLGVAVFPALAQAISKSNISDFSEMILKTVRQLMFIMAPATVLFFVLRAQIVRLTLGYGQFDWTDTVLTIQTLSLFLIGLVFQGALTILLRAYFALENARTPFWVLLFGVLISLAAALVLAPFLDVPALALGMSLAAIFNTLALLAILVRRGQLENSSSLLKPLGVFIFSAFLAGAAAYGVLHLAVLFLNTHKVLHLIIQGGFAGLAGLAVYILSNFIFRTEEMMWFKSKLGFRTKIILPSLDEETRQ